MGRIRYKLENAVKLPPIFWEEVEERQVTDCVFVVQGQRIEAHRNVLSAWSEYLEVSF